MESQEIKETLSSNAIHWDKKESQDRAYIYVDDFVKDLQSKMNKPKTITTHESQPIQDFARQVAKTVKEDWGSHNVDEFVEVFKKEVDESEKYCECEKPTLGKSVGRCGTCDEWFKKRK